MAKFVSVEECLDDLKLKEQIVAEDARKKAKQIGVTKARASQMSV